MPLDKLELLEQRMTLLLQRINQLQADKKNLEEQVVQLNNKTQLMAQELEANRLEIGSLSLVKDENQRFREERGHVYERLESMLTNLEGISA